MLKDQIKEQATASSDFANSSAKNVVSSYLLPPYILLSAQLFYFLSVYTDLQTFMVN